MQSQDEMLRYWVWLSLAFGAGSTKLLHYISQLESPKDVYEAIQAGMLPGLPKTAQKGMTEHTIGEADSIVYYCKSHGIRLLPISDPDYPDELHNIYAPPVLLTACGNLALLKKPMRLSVVGTRNPSPYTEKVTAEMIRELCPHDFVIVSGFARGVDAIAHAAALGGGAGTIGVLGCGVNVNYPRQNSELRERMLSGGNGLLLSEYMPGTQPFPGNFPKRNRILSGLSYATAVMEAAAHSGSLVTAQCAVEQGRYLFCVPPADLFEPRYAGVIPWIRDGAIPLMSHQDILMAYYAHYPQYLKLTENSVKQSECMVYREQTAPPQPKQETVFQEPEESASVPEESAAPQNEGRMPDSEEGRAVVRFLRLRENAAAEEIADELDMDLSRTFDLLLDLELDGFVESLFGKTYRLFEQ